MKKTVLLVCLVFTIVSVRTNAQKSAYQRLNEQWEQFLEADENEKDFRRHSFLRLVEKSVKGEVVFPDSISFLSGWTTDTTDDDRFRVHTTYVRYSDRPDQVLYCFQDDRNDEVFAGFISLNKKYKKPEVIPRLKSYALSDARIVELEYMSSEEEILNIPDLELAMMLESLMRSEGANGALEKSEWIENRLDILMQAESLFNNDFSGYSGLSTLISSDFEDQIKITTWNVEDLGGDHYFFGVIALKNKEGVKTFSLQDSRNKITNAEFKLLTPSKWFGAVYYDIIPVKDKNTVYYTLLGYNGNDAFSRIRLIDVLTLDKQKKPRFGASIFDSHEPSQQRLIFEHSNKANMMLRYDERNNRIIMDHLAPLEPRFEGDHSYYGPDFSYDALEFRKGKWVLVEDVEVRNQ